MNPIEISMAQQKHILNRSPENLSGLISFVLSNIDQLIRVIHDPIFLCFHILISPIKISMAQYEHILTNPPENFCGSIYHCVLATLINSSEQTQYLLLVLFQLTRKICGTIFLMYHIVLQPHRNICVCNMYMCSSLLISSIEIQLYGSVGLGQFIVYCFSSPERSVAQQS